MMNAEYRAFRVFQRTRLSGERPAPRFSSSCMLNIITAVPANSCTPRRTLTGKAGLLNTKHCKGYKEVLGFPRQRVHRQVMWVKSSPQSN